MLKMNNIEDYQNLVEVLKQALLFYAECDVEKITIDKGFQAKFALSKIDEVEKEYKKMEDEFISETLKSHNENNNLKEAIKNLISNNYGNNQI